MPPIAMMLESVNERSSFIWSTSCFQIPPVLLGVVRIMAKLPARAAKRKHNDQVL